VCYSHSLHTHSHLHTNTSSKDLRYKLLRTNSKNRIIAATYRIMLEMLIASGIFPILYNGTWHVRKVNEVALQQAEMRIVRWVCDIKLKRKISK